jgi:rod shape determining protein RodA
LLEDRVWSQIDWLTLGLILALCAVGFVMILSTTQAQGTETGQRQLLWLALGLGAMILVMAVDYHTWASMAFVLYGISMLALLYPLVMGREIAGARAWIELGPFNLQPSEIAKVTTALAMATFLSRRAGHHLGIWNLTILGVLVGIPVGLILLQPDMGTLIPFIPLLGTMALVGGIRLRTLVILSLVAALILPFLWSSVLKDYQKERLLTFLDPERDPHGSGYQVLQSKIALGSGGVSGKGFFSGTQGQLHFLPAQHTDFIFAVVGEEGGFLATAGLLVLYYLLFQRCFRAAETSRDLLGVYLVLGLISVLATQVLFNVGVVMGMMPTAGTTLPLMSYGGSSLVTTLVLLGLIMNVRMRRFVN